MLAREKWQAKTIKVLEMVFDERVRQVARYGHNEDLEDGFGPTICWTANAGGYDGPTAVEIQEIFRRDYEKHEALRGNPTWMHLIREEIAEWLESEPDDPEAITEALQAAALLVSWVEKRTS